jgi:hypothetical protein
MAAVVPWGRLVLIGPAGREAASWEVGGTGPPDLAAVHALARAALAARRGGGRLRVVEASADLAALLALVGLGGEVGWEPEGGEEVGVEEGVVPGDRLA